MVTGIIGKKVGMTQLFDEGGRVRPATVIKAGPCVVVQAKTSTKDGYEAVQLGLVEERPVRVTRPIAGHFKKAELPPTRILREVASVPGEEPMKLGDQVLVSMFTDGDRVDVIGTSRGKGFQGVMKRHGFSGGRASHGSMFHRSAGFNWCFVVSVSRYEGNAGTRQDGRSSCDCAQPAGGTSR